VIIDTGTSQKEIRIGGGVVIEVPGTRWRVNAEVLAITQDEQMLKVKGPDFEGWIPRTQVKDALSPGDFAFDTAINVIGGDDDL